MSRKNTSNKPTEAELEVLQVLWKNGASSVREVHQAIHEEKGVGYTTTLKIMQNMLEKSLVSRDPSNRVHIYQAEVDEEKTQKKLLDRFLETTFGGSAMKLVMQALGNHQATPEEIEKIKKMLEQQEKDKN